ncbi:hypothetical protein OAF54_02910 [bacterium]|nr:hypothetical protein [bacterium]
MSEQHVERPEFLEHKRDNEKDHDGIWDVLNKVRERLPHWAVFVFAAGGALIGFLANMAIGG